MTDADLLFLPWARRGAASAVLAPDPFDATPAGVVTTTASITINNAAPAKVPITLMGPGHVKSMDRRQLIRTDPAPGSRTFEPNFLPLAEFDEPSLPWLFTPATSGAHSRLRPWLCLVVVRKQTGVSVGPPVSGALPALRIAAPAVIAEELPDLAESWAWAHVSVIAESGAAETAILDELDTMPERSSARLICPRVLAPDTDYIACVVPTFELGRKAGLGLDITADDEAHLADAWHRGDTAVELPVYHQWDFSTGDGGDFRSLALLLHARELPPGVGMQPIDVGASGLPAPVPPGTVLSLAGALRPVGSAATHWPSPAMKTAWEAALEPVLDAPATITATQDPLLAPPLYGAGQGGWSALSATHPTRWFETLNLSPLHRAVAHLGAAVVQANQDQLMASAWAQAADLRRANETLHRLQLACSLATSLHTRHVAPMDPAVGLQVLAPARHRLVRGPSGVAFAAALANTGLPASALSVALRRISRPLGVIARRGTQAAGGIVVRPSALFRLLPTAPSAAVPVTPSGPVTLESVAASLVPPRTDLTWREATAAAVTGAPPRPWFAFVPLGVPVPDRPPPPHQPPVVGHPPIGPVAGTVLTGEHVGTALTAALPTGPGGPGAGPVGPGGPGGGPIDPPGGTDSAAAAQFRQIAAALLDRFVPPLIMVGPPIPAPGGSLADAFSAALIATAPRPAFAARAAQLLDFGSGAAPQELDPVRLAPYFPQPMVEPLIEIAQHLVLPGLDGVPPNTVVPLETNSAFVAAYLVGLNTEMARELLWREFATDLTATFFDRFWNASSAPGRGPDVSAIATWGDGELGGAGADDERFVLLLRSELLQRYPNAIIYATKGGETRDPVFTGGFEPDVRYFGFDIHATEIPSWSIVIEEHPSAPRFGIDVGADTGGGSHLHASAANSAATAQALRRQPVRLTIPATVLLGAQ